MKKLMKKMLTFASVLGAAAILAGCASTCGQKKPHHKKYNNRPQAEVVETTVFYQTYDAADVNRVYAKMYTRSSSGGDSRMGHIKFYETDSGLKMDVDLKDMRPGVEYTLRVYQCGSCTGGMCCAQSPMAINLPKLRAGNSGKLEESFIVRGLTAAQLNNAKLYMERDGGYKAAWGTLEK